MLVLTSRTLKGLNTLKPKTVTVKKPTATMMQVISVTNMKAKVTEVSTMTIWVLWTRTWKSETTASVIRGCKISTHFKKELEWLWKMLLIVVFLFLLFFSFNLQLKKIGAVLAYSAPPELQTDTLQDQPETNSNVAHSTGCIYF